MQALIEHPWLKGYFSLIRRFIPRQPEKVSFGVDIGAGDCKLVEINRKTEGCELKSWATEPVKNDDYKTALQTLLSSRDLENAQIYTSVFGKGTLIRYISMPRMSLDDLKDSFSIEADKYFPFAQDQIYTDCYILDENGKDKNMAVMAAAAKKEIIDERVAVLKELGISSDFIGINAIAVANVINILGFEGEKENEVVALLDIGESVSNLSILVDRQPRFTRDIYIGGQNFTKNISTSMGISMEEAEKIKRDPGKKQDKVLSACETTVNNIVQELQLSLDYFSSENGYDTGRLLITGGGSMLEEIDKIFEKNLEIAVNHWNPLERVDVPKEMEEDLKKNSFKLGVALGLALYAYD